MIKRMVFFFALLSSTMISAQDLAPVKLKKPNMNRGSSVMEALANRKSGNDYATKMLNIDDLSDLLWAANGINRPESGKRTAASAMNRQDVSIYTFTANGLETRPRAFMDREGISRLLKLNNQQLPLLNNAVGYPK